MPDPAKRRHRTRLDEQRRRMVIALLTNGSSRRVAAAMVGCAPSTITRAAARDRQFARQLVEAERNVEVEALRRVREASKDPRHWRAAAWMLERRNPDDFGPRPPKMFSQVAVAALLSNICQMLTGTVPEENCRRAQAYLDRLMLDLRSETAHTAYLAPPGLIPETQEPPGPLATADDLQDAAGDDEARGDATDGAMER